jgi:hypothetical protein
MLSRISVRIRPDRHLRHRCSSQYLRISPLHWEFPGPLRTSRLMVSGALPQLSRGISHPTTQSACTRFTPSNSEQRLHPPYYRGCWHGVSRCFLCRYRQTDGVLFPPEFRPCRQSFTTRRPSSLTRRCCVRLSPIAQYSPLLPPVGVWPVFQCQCG